MDLVCASNSEVFQILEQNGQGARVLAMGPEDGRWDRELGTFGQNDCSLAYVTAAPLNIPASEYNTRRCKQKEGNQS